MDRKKNLLVTTLGYTENHLQIEYYAADGAAGELKFCTGISGAEAGAKYILSHYAIDEIIVLGPPNAAASGPLLQDLEHFRLVNGADLRSCSEFDFFCYRLQQFLEHLDIEAQDILHGGDPETLDRLRGVLAKELSRGRDGAFYLAVTEEEARARFQAAARQLPSAEALRRLKHLMYLEMDSYFKLRALRCNSGLPVRFVPMEKEAGGSFSVEGMAAVIERLAAHCSEGVEVYVDLQGMDRADSYTMLSLLRLAYSAEQKVRIRCMIHTRRLPGSFVNRIENEIGRYDFELLLAGMQAFTAYGKSGLLEEFCSSRQIRDKSVTDLLKAMKYVDTGVSLCNPEDLKYGIQALKKIFLHAPEPEARSPEAAVFDTVKRGIRRDYGPLLEGEELSLPELIDWALRKHFYQQALTMIESLVPGDLVQRGILYYARDREDVREVLRRWNIAYWNEIPKCRYVFRDPDHYFIKNYGRLAVDHAQAPQNVARDLARIMVEQQRCASEALCPVYSCLEDDALLYELLLRYYSLGSLRNRVSHANSHENALNGQEELTESNSFALLQESIAGFLAVYRSACRRAEGAGVQPLRIRAGELRQYVRRHRLLPLGADSGGNLLDSHYQCRYNGQDLLISIRMLAPEEEWEGP